VIRIIEDILSVLHYHQEWSLAKRIIVVVAYFLLGLVGLLLVFLKGV
jgi:hypothetical protein